MKCESGSEGNEDKMSEKTAIATGKEALEVLAKRFPQLYVAPAEGAQDAHRAASGRGIAPEGANLDHFTSTPEDELRVVDTPAGPIEVLFLKDRADFECILKIIGHKSQPVDIARTVGAITYRGLADWSKVRAAYAAYTASGGEDWGAEFARLARDPQAFRAELIIISEGSYSNISADQTAYGEDEGVRVSREIRLHHECAHVVCRRLMPDDILPVWDEVTADITGLLCATGEYDPALAALFLGVTADGYAGGRLEEYLAADQRGDIERIAVELHAALNRVPAAWEAAGKPDPFDFLLQLKREPMVNY